MEKTNRANKLFTCFVVVVLIVGSIWLALSNRWHIHDWWVLRNHTTSAAVQDLASVTTMRSNAQRVFFASLPTIISNKQDFTSKCHISEQTIVLGCFVEGKSIYIYDIQDDRLKGIVYVTAAHEMLHAEYARLTGSQKKRVDELTQRAYAQMSDQRIEDTIENYKKNNANIPNELHSILGTEVRDLPQDLEDYYAKIFANREAIVGLSEEYEKIFTDNKAEIGRLDARLGQENQGITAAQKDLEEAYQSILSNKDTMDALRESGNIAKYNSLVPDFNSRVNDYNSRVESFQQQIDQYNKLVADRNAISIEQNQLYKAIDSRASAVNYE